MLLQRGRREFARRLLHQRISPTQAAVAEPGSPSISSSSASSVQGERLVGKNPKKGKYASGDDRQNHRDYCAGEWLLQQRAFSPTQRIATRDISAEICRQQQQWKHLNLGLRQVSELQRCGMSTSAQCSAGEVEGKDQPVRSPLSQAPGPLGSGGQASAVSPTRTAQAVLKGIRQSPQKLNLVAEMVRGMRVEDALTQMQVSLKRAAKTVFKVVHSAQANAVHNFGLEKDRLVVSEAFVGKDRYLKRVMPHGKGKAGKLVHPKARLTVVVKEMSPEQDADLARLRVFRMRGTRMSRAQARLVPHRVLAAQWSRKREPAAASDDIGP